MTIHIIINGKWQKITLGVTGVYLNGRKLSVGEYSTMQFPERCPHCNHKEEK